MLILDSGGLSRLARRDEEALARIIVFRRDGLWPALVPSVVLVESISGRPRADVLVNRLLKTCNILEQVPEALARRSAELRALAGRGSAVDAVVVAVAEPHGCVLTGDVGDLRAIATHADDVTILRA